MEYMSVAKSMILLYILGLTGSTPDMFLRRPSDPAKPDKFIGRRDEKFIRFRRFQMEYLPRDAFQRATHQQHLSTGIQAGQ